MKEKKEVKFVGIGFAEALTLLFIGLKLGKVISWSWVWILSPLWISAALIVVVCIVALVLTSLDK